MDQQRKEDMDPAARAARGLEAALGEEAVVEGVTVVGKELEEKQAEQAAVRSQKEAERAEAAAALNQTTRRKLRLLVVSRDASFFTDGSPLHREYVALAPHFEQLHVIVLNRKKRALPENVRIAENAWLYATNAGGSLGSIVSAYRVAKRQLSLASGFYADSVLATGAHAEGMTAYLIARRHQRTVQLLLSESPFGEGGQKVGLLARIAARFVVRRADCLVVRAERVMRLIVDRFPKLKERITVLPPFHDIAFFRDATPALDVRAQYPQFKFIILVASHLSVYDRADFALDVCIPFLRQYPTLGVLIVGDGDQRSVLEKRVADEGLTERVVFIPDSSDLLSYLKAAHILLNVAADEEHDATIASAAAAGIPVLTTAGGIADTLFRDGESAFVCAGDNVGCFQARLGEFLSDNRLREELSLNGRNQVFATPPQDADAYRKTLVGVLESCVLAAYTDAP